VPPPASALALATIATETAQALTAASCTSSHGRCPKFHHVASLQVRKFVHYQALDFLGPALVPVRVFECLGEKPATASVRRGLQDFAINRSRKNASTNSPAPITIRKATSSSLILDRQRKGGANARPLEFASAAAPCDGLSAVAECARSAAFDNADFDPPRETTEQQWY
jgi:hypothetical protein